MQRIHLKNKKQVCEHIIIQLFHNPLFCTFEFPLTLVITCSFILEAGLWTLRMQNTVHSVLSLLKKYILTWKHFQNIELNDEWRCQNRLINPSVILYLFHQFSSHTWIFYLSTQFTYVISFSVNNTISSCILTRNVQWILFSFLKAFPEKTHFHCILGWHERKEASQYFLRKHNSIIFPQLF